MTQQCMTPGCKSRAAFRDVLCPECRRQSDNSRIAVDVVNLDGVRENCHIPAIENLGAELAPDMTALVAHQIRERQQRENIIRRLQKRLDFRGTVIRRLIGLLSAETARADGLEQQLAGVQAALSAQTEQLAQLEYLRTGQRKNGFAAVETAVGDWRPFDQAGYNVLYERIDPVSNRPLAWYWFRADTHGV